MKLFHNAKIYTLDPAGETASALAIEGDKVLALGGEELCEEFPQAAMENLQGQVILPGLVDGHLHLQEYALSRHIVDCEVDGKEEILSRLSEKIKHVPAGEWVRGHGWNQNTWGGSWPTAQDLDAISPANPLYLSAKSLHAAWVNTRALALAGIFSGTDDPANGAIGRDKDHNPTGILFEEAVLLVERMIPAPTPASLAQSFLQTIPDLWRMGLTGVHDFDKRTCFQALQLLHGQGQLGLRVLKSIPRELLPQAEELGLRSGLGDDFLRLGSVKLFSDGALGPHTGAMFAGYVDDPENRGILILNEEALLEIGRPAVENGISLAVHAIGDRAVHEVLQGFSRIRAYERERGLKPLRHRIEHVQTIDPQDAGKLAELNLLASMQPVHATSDMLVAERALGARAAFSYAWKTQLQNGARLVFGSDAPVESPNPFHGLHAAVTRRRPDGSPGKAGWFPEQRLTLREALAGFTLGPAYAAGMESRQGCLAPGFLADLMILDKDPFTMDPADLFDLKPTATMVGGNWMWRS